MCEEAARRSDRVKTLMSQKAMERNKEDEDYGDYVTRCICDFKHDDGYMIQCDGCSVWQHVECMLMDPRNLPDKYLCETCEPRPVDRKRARQLQIAKRDDLSGTEEARGSHSPEEGPERKGQLGSKKKKKRPKPPEMKVEPPKRSKKEREKVEQAKKVRRKPLPRSAHNPLPLSRTGSIQSLLTAASLLDDCWPDVWNVNASPWSDKYETAEYNRYSEPVRQFVAGRMGQLKSEAVVYGLEEFLTRESRGAHPQCFLVEVQRRRKGVATEVGAEEDELVMEYKGKITVKHAVLNEMSPGGKSLWKHRPCPFAYLYDKISDIDICIDARHYGNLARFIRRSCSPNSELRHFFIASELHFGVYATQSISPGEEITLPFDFQYEKCDYPIECGCGQKGVCLVARSNQDITIRKQLGKPTEEERHSRSSSRSRPQPPSHTSSRGEGPSGRGDHTPHTSSLAVLQDEDSNSSWVSTGSRKRSQRHHRGPFSPARQSSRQTSREVSSESEEEAGSEAQGKRTKSREERKTEAVWRMFEKMEASQRRRQQLHSEGSMDSDSLSPSALHPPSLLLAQRHSKERRSSTTSAKKVQLLPGGKVRLSSVSSGDGFSPADFSEAFSPPITPGLAAPEGPYAAPYLTSPPHLTSPPPTPQPSFQVTPFLHPKYLFAEFALPWKKAILKQWESEQQQNENAPCQNWSISSRFPVYRVANESSRQRVRGCLKHRWLKQHQEQANAAPQRESGSSDKENCRENGAGQEGTMLLPHKKRVLLKWQQDRDTLPSSATPPAAPAKPSPLSLTWGMPGHAEAATEPSSSREAGNSCNSPLFDDFSDGDEFELLEGGRKSSSGGERREDQRGRALEEVGSGREEEEEEQESGPRTPPLVGDEDSRLSAPETPPSVTHPPNEESNLSSISDTSLISDNERMDVEPCSPPPDSKLNFPRPPAVPADTGSAVGTESELPNPSESVADQTGDVALEEEPVSAAGALEPVVPSPGAPDDVLVGVAACVGDKAEPEGIQEVPMELPSPARGKEKEEVAVAESSERVEGAADGRPELPEAPAEEKSQLVTREAAPEETREGGLERLASAEALSLKRDSLASEEGGCGSGASSPDARANTSPTAVPTKTPGKRKINLSEYRNRARKPMEPRKSATETPPPSTSLPPSFLTHTLLSTPSLLATTYTHGLLVPGAIGTVPSAGVSTTAASGGVAASTIPQFEPVSPDDGDHTPPLVTMEDSSQVPVDEQLQSQMAASGLLVPNITSYPAQGIMAGEGAGGQIPVSYIQQTPGGQFVPDNRWTTMQPLEHTQDPRRGALPPGEQLFPSQQPLVQPQQMGGLHGGLLPHPSAHVIQQQQQQHPLHTQGMLPQQHGEVRPQGLLHRQADYHPRQPAPPPRPHGFHQPRPLYRPRHPGHGSSYY